MSDYGQPNYGQPNYGQPNYGQQGQPGWQQGPPPGQPGGPPPGYGQGGYPQSGAPGPGGYGPGPGGPGGYGPAQGGFGPGGPGGPEGFGPGGFGPGGYGPPPAKSRTGLIVGIIVVLVLVGGGIGLAVGLSGGGGGATKDNTSAKGALATFVSGLNSHDAGAIADAICADTTDETALSIRSESALYAKAAQSAKVLTPATGSGSAATGVVQATGGTNGKTETDTLRASLKQESGKWCIDSFDQISGGETTHSITVGPTGTGSVQSSGSGPSVSQPTASQPSQPSISGGGQGGSSASSPGTTDARAKAVLTNFTQFLDHHDATDAKSSICGDAIGRAAQIKTLPQTNFDRIVTSSVTSIGAIQGDVTQGHIDITDNDGPQDYLVTLHQENNDWCVYDL